jgi:site-specific DNA-adenine methylase
MFSYYGTKKKLAPLYDNPRYSTIIEPFAGAAGYSLHSKNFEKNVVLYDVNPKIAACWDFLIKATPGDIKDLPDLSPGQKVTDFDLSPAEQALIGFCINPGSSTPKITASQRTTWNRYKVSIAENVSKIKHWKIFNASYEDTPNIEATWFIDPPYQTAGKYYFGFNRLDFTRLGAWCKSRQGQVIVCENAGADWLPFRFLTKHQGSIQANVEVIWSNDDPNGDLR